MGALNKYEAEGYDGRMRTAAKLRDKTKHPFCKLQNQEGADKAILSVESGGPADIALACSAVVRWLCVAGFSRVCPSIFLSAGLGGSRRCNVSKKRNVEVRSLGASSNAGAIYASNIAACGV